MTLGKPASAVASMLLRILARHSAWFSSRFSPLGMLVTWRHGADEAVLLERGPLVGRAQLDRLQPHCRAGRGELVKVHLGRTSVAVIAPETDRLVESVPASRRPNFARQAAKRRPSPPRPPRGRAPVRRVHRCCGSSCRSLRSLVMASCWSRSWRNIGKAHDEPPLFYHFAAQAGRSAAWRTTAKGASRRTTEQVKRSCSR